MPDELIDSALFTVTENINDMKTTVPVVTCVACVCKHMTLECVFLTNLVEKHKLIFLQD